MKRFVVENNFFLLFGTSLRFWNVKKKDYDFEEGEEVEEDKELEIEDEENDDEDEEERSSEEEEEEDDEEEEDEITVLDKPKGGQGGERLVRTERGNKDISEEINPVAHARSRVGEKEPRKDMDKYLARRIVDNFVVEIPEVDPKMRNGPTSWTLNSR